VAVPTPASAHLVARPGRMAGRGRPTKLTPERRDDLVLLLAAGASTARAARCVGVSERSVTRWLRDGLAERVRLARAAGAVSTRSFLTTLGSGPSRSRTRLTRRQANGWVVPSSPPLRLASARRSQCSQRQTRSATRSLLARPLLFLPRRGNAPHGVGSSRAAAPNRAKR
jgi:hypothetical protein